MSDETKSEGKGALVMKLTSENFVRIGDIEIYLKGVDVSGKISGKPVVSIRLVAPKNIKILRCER